MRRAGGAVRRPVMVPSPWTRSVTLGRRVVDRRGEPSLIGDQRPDHLADQPGSDVPGLLAGGEDGYIAALIPLTEAGSVDPTGEGFPAASQQAQSPFIGIRPVWSGNPHPPGRTGIRLLELTWSFTAENHGKYRNIPKAQF